MFDFVVLSCLFIAALLTPAGKGLPVCCVFFVRARFCHLPIWCSVSGVVLDRFLIFGFFSTSSYRQTMKMAMHTSYVYN